MIIQPPPLKKNNTIGITCPAGYMPMENAATCIETLNQWGFRVVVGKTLGSDSDNYFSAPDEERLNELQQMLDDKNIHAILFGRGGYGVGRIIDKLNFRKFRKHPKWIIGFSDITVLHCHLFTKYKIATVHGPMAALFREPEAEDSILALKAMLGGKKTNYKLPAHPLNKFGKASGKIVGGNLALLCNLIGTPSDVNTKNCILYIEDTGEYLYSIDRMLHQLKRSGKTKKLAGLILGGFTEMKDTTRPYGKDIFQILEEFAASADCPVCFDFPLSHGNANLPLKNGVMHQLNISASGVQLKEL